MPWWGRIRSGAADPTHLAHLVGHKVYALADGDRAEVLVPLALETGRGARIRLMPPLSESYTKTYHA